MKMAENPKFNEYKAQIIEILAKMFDYLALDGDFKVEEKGQRIGVAIASENAGRIIGRKGQTLESLQLLLNRMMFKMDEECPHITLDIDGYASGDRENRSDDAPAADGEAPREYHRRPRHGKGGDAPRVSKEQLEKQEFKSQLEQEQLEKQEFKSQLEQKQLEIETLLKKYENLKGSKSEASK